MSNKFERGDHLYWHGDKRTVPVTYIKPGRTEYVEVAYGHVSADEPTIYPTMVSEKKLRRTK